MNSKQQETILFYKQLEAEINKRIHASTNSRTFTAAVGKTMDSHLREVRKYKRLTTSWLNRMDLATKDELAVLSNRLVEVEEEIDSLDESIYQMINMQKTNQKKLRMIRGMLEEWSIYLKSEVQEQRCQTIKTLEDDLEELKQSFKMEFNKEEMDNG
jgi:BMFP domain-containing protein YqiC